MFGVALRAMKLRQSALLIAAASAAPLVLGSGPAAFAANSSALRLITTIPINGTAANTKNSMYSFDISWVDPANGLYYLADRSNAALDVIDTTGAFTGKPDSLFGQIGGPSVGFAGYTGNNATSGPDGVTASFPCIFAGDGTSRVVSFNANVSFTTVASSISTGGKFRADELAYDPKDGIVFAANNADDPPYGTLITVDKSTCKMSNPVKVSFSNMPGGFNATNGAEQPVWDPGTQRFYISIPEVNGPGDGTGPNGGVARVTTSGTVENFYQINYCQPSGLALGPNGDLLAQCSVVFDTSGKACSAATASGAPATCTGQAYPQVAVCNPARGCTGNALVSIPGPGGGDEGWFNPGDNNYYITGSNNPVGAVLAVAGSGASSQPNTLVQLVPTLPPVASVKGGHPSGTVHSVAASAMNNHVYVPLPANTSYPNCGQGCIAVFGAQ